MAEQPGAERTEQPTQQRREKARREGQVAVSQELGIAGSLLVFLAFVFLLVPWLAQLAVERFRTALMFDWPPVLTSELSTRVVTYMGGTLLALVGPVAAASLLVNVGLSLAQVGVQVNFSLVGPKASRLDPRNWLKRVFSADFFVNLGKNLFKGLGVIAIAAWSLRLRPETLDRLTLGPPAVLASWMQSVAMAVAARVTAALVVIALLDLLWTRYRHEQRLMMTKQEVKDELKESEGNPQIKAAIRKRAAERATKRLVQQVKTATVVATNPTHFAVALRYERGTDASPVVVAKGVDHRASRIRSLASEYGIPMIEDPPLARALHALVKEGQSVPVELFRPVARLLAIVYRRRGGTSR
ncbi:MAG: flagellar biosynthesis protein FlhB [Myxococcota bacterium]